MGAKILRREGVSQAMGGLLFWFWIKRSRFREFFPVGTATRTLHYRLARESF